LGVELLLGRGLLCVEIGVALEVDARVAELREVARALRLRLLELRLEAARIELAQELALLHVLAFDEAHALELAVDTRLHGHARLRSHRAKAGAEDRHVLHLHAHRRDRHRRGGARWRRGLVPETPPEPQRNDDEQQHAADREDASARGAGTFGIGHGEAQGLRDDVSLAASGVPADQPPPIAAISATLVVICRLRSCTAVRAFESASACAVTTAR
jgi:hypothetical protein